MTDYFYKHQLRIFDYPKWAEPLRQELRQNLERIAAENAREIEFVRSRKSFRKEDRVKQILEKRGEHPGVVCILSALEPCGSYKPWHDKRSHPTPPDISQAGRWQLPSLLRLLPGRRSGALLPAGADVVPFPAAVLLQRPQLSGTTDEPAPPRVPASGQRLRLDCRLPTGAEAGRRVSGRKAAPQTGRLRRSLLPSGEAVRAGLPLESGSGGVRHRHRVPQTE